MTEREHAAFNLPELDRTDDPRGGAVAWALLAVGVVVLGGIFLLVMWLTGVW
jgi:formate hydrogenlyase subunit 3/multisubunit Na+/H+ antiporter MnhD subunit